MIHHCVFVRFRSDVTEADKLALWGDLRSLVGVLPGLLELRAGANARYEDLDQGFADGFIAVFDGPLALSAYQTHPLHRATGARLVAAAQGGLQGLLVFDLEAP